MVYQYGFSLCLNFVQCASSACISLIFLVRADVRFCFLFVRFYFFSPVICSFYLSVITAQRYPQDRGGGGGQEAEHKDCAQGQTNAQERSLCE